MQNHAEKKQITAKKKYGTVLYKIGKYYVENFVRSRFLSSLFKRYNYISAEKRKNKLQNILFDIIPLSRSIAIFQHKAGILTFAILISPSHLKTHTTLCCKNLQTVDLLYFFFLVDENLLRRLQLRDSSRFTRDSLFSSTYKAEAP